MIWGSLLPVIWQVRANPVKYDQQILVNWLDVEVPGCEQHPILEELRGWRNREVFEYVRSYDWTARMYDR